MLRPSIINILAIRSDNILNIKSIIHLEEFYSTLNTDKLNFPLKNINQLFSKSFHIKLILYDDQHHPILENTYKTNNFGEFNIKISLEKIKYPERISRIQIYEISFHENIEILLGSFLLYNSETFKKIIISDFDKTLAETSSKNPKEIWGSLTSPITAFPTINSSLEIIQENLKKNYVPFIVSSSPHFYESSIRDWLYQHEIYNANILLKDYRQMISIREDRLKIKDVLAHGFYKLDHIFNIIFMTGIPDKLILMGDNHEADHLIYLILAKIMSDDTEPRDIWNNIKNNKYFKLSNKQNSILLENLYKISNMIKQNKKNIDLQIYIRQFRKETNWKHLPSFIDKKKYQIKYYPKRTLGANKTI